ncbi:MAG: CbrC family protein [Gemmataceae bacterium]
MFNAENIRKGDEDQSSMSKTFAQLGIPFRLFEGPSDQASEYCASGLCSQCSKNRQHCFRLGIGCAIMVSCPACGTENGLDADDREDCMCRRCKSDVPFPDLGEDEVKICYDCLRVGKAAITKDTELGMISWEQAFEGVTHGIPGLDRADFEMVPKDDDWVGARLPEEVMFEMLRTPTYSTIQGEHWQFCCQQPMVFLGEWTREDFAQRALDGDGKRYFEEVVQDCIPGLWEDELHDITGVYVFRCQTCYRVTAHWDIA